MGLMDWFRSPKSRFAREVQAAAVRAGLDKPVYDAQEDALRFDAYVLNLGNLFVRWNDGSRDEKKEAVRLAVQTAMDGLSPLPKTWEEAAPYILPSVQDRLVFAVGPLSAVRHLADFESLPHRVLGDHEAIGLVLDREDTMAMVLNGMLEDWGVDVETAFERALSNLHARTPPKPERVELLGSCYLLAEDGYGAAGMLRAEALSALDLPGDPVACVLERDAVLICGSDDPGLQTIVRSAQALAGQADGRRASALPLVFRDGAWVRFERPDIDEFLRPAETQWVGAQYGTVKSMADKLDDDVFFATVLGTNDGRTFTMWQHDLSMMLPATDIVAFTQAMGRVQHGCANGPRVRRELAHLLELDERFYPPMYRVLGFPEQAFLDSLVDDPMATPT